MYRNMSNFTVTFLTRAETEPFAVAAQNANKRKEEYLFLQGLLMKILPISWQQR